MSSADYRIRMAAARVSCALAGGAHLYTRAARVAGIARRAVAPVVTAHATIVAVVRMLARQCRPSTALRTDTAPHAVAASVAVVRARLEVTRVAHPACTHARAASRCHGRCIDLGTCCEHPPKILGDTSMRVRAAAVALQPPERQRARSRHSTRCMPSSPPGKHWHCPFMHTPCLLQSLGHA